MNLEIGKPCELPDRAKRGSYYCIWEQVENLTDGDWLPITGDSFLEARRVYMAALKHGF